MDRMQREGLKRELPDAIHRSTLTLGGEIDSGGFGMNKLSCLLF